jgi:hypothetical protein
MKVWSGIYPLPPDIFYWVTEPAKNSAREYLGDESRVRCGWGLRKTEEEER